MSYDGEVSRRISVDAKVYNIHCWIYQVGIDINEDESHSSYLRERRGSFRRRSVKVEDTRRLQKLYNNIIQTVQGVESTLPIGDRRLSLIRGQEPLRHSDTGAPLDMAALKKLERTLNNARLYTARKPTKEDHYRHDVCSNRAQKELIDELDAALGRHIREQEEVEAEKVLPCRYLRLSKPNVQTLEEIIRKRGGDPGIHHHSDLADIDIWKGLRQERSDLVKAPTETAAEAANRKERGRKTTRGSIFKY